MAPIGATELLVMPTENIKGSFHCTRKVLNDMIVHSGLEATLKKKKKSDLNLGV